MSIPNAEVKYIYHNTILNWFRDEIKTKDLSEMYQAMLVGDTERFQAELARPPVILELKVSDTFKGMEAAADKALWQKEEKQCLVKVVKKKLI